MRKYRLIPLLLIGLYLGTYHGHIALFDREKTQPVEVFPYLAENYPQHDQQALQKGIPVTSRDHLEKLLEDFTS